MLTLIIYIVIGYVAGRILVQGFAFAAAMSVIKRAEKAEAIAAPVKSEPAHYNCDVSSERIFEERLVEAGILKVSEMTTCEAGHSCPNCGPTWDALKVQHREKQKQEKRKAIEARQDNVHDYRSHKRHAVVYGRKVPLPNNVPTRAEATIVQTHGGEQVAIGWTWTVEGKMMRFLQPVDLEMLESFPKAFPVAKEYREGQIKELESYEVEVDQLLDAPRVFKSSTMPPNLSIGDTWEVTS